LTGQLRAWLHSTLRAHRRNERLDTDDVHHAHEIVGEHVQRNGAGSYPGRPVAAGFTFLKPNSAKSNALTRPPPPNARRPIADSPFSRSQGQQRRITYCSGESVLAQLWDVIGEQQNRHFVPKGDVGPHMRNERTSLAVDDFGDSTA
jgi:hypothetical protein